MHTIISPRFEIEILIVIKLITFHYFMHVIRGKKYFYHRMWFR